MPWISRAPKPQRKHRCKTPCLGQFECWGLHRTPQPGDVWQCGKCDQLWRITDRTFAYLNGWEKI